MKNLSKIVAYKIPSYVSGFLNDHGYETENINSFTDDLKSILFFEDIIMSPEKFAVFKKIISKHKFENITIFVMHIFNIPQNHLDELDHIATNCKINLIVNGCPNKTYKNIVTHEWNVIEQQLGHHDLYVASKLLKEKSNIVYDFMAVVNLKRAYRQKIFNGLNATNIFTNSKLILSNFQQVRYEPGGEKLFSKQKKLLDYLDAQQAGKSLGQGYKNTNAFPAFHLYEKCFCEIVCESGDLQTGDVSEKTYKPFLLEKPIVWLGCENAFEKLKRDGYKFYDHDFYKKFFNSTIDNQIQQLYHFLDHIRKSDQVKKQMEKIAKENYINFWNTRKIDIPYQNYKILKQCFGDSLHEVAYDYCNF